MPGAAINQPERVMGCMMAAWKVWYVTDFKPRNHKQLTDQDDDYMKWVLEGYRPTGSSYG